MRNTKRECKYGLEYSNEDIRCLINSVEALKDVLRANIVEANKNTKSLETMAEKVAELNKMVEQFNKMAEELPTGKWKIVTAGAVVGGGLVGSTTIDISCASPATAPIAGTIGLSVAEVCLSAGLAGGGAALGGLSGSAYTAGMFSKRSFVKFGRSSTPANKRGIGMQGYLG